MSCGFILRYIHNSLNAFVFIAFALCNIIIAIYYNSWSALNQKILYCSHKRLIYDELMGVVNDDQKNDEKKDQSTLAYKI